MSTSLARPGTPAVEEGLFDVEHYLGILRERRFVLLGALLSGLVCAGLWTATQPRIYEARASILVEATVPQVLGSEVREIYDSSPANYYMMQDYMQTSRRVIMSDSLAQRVAARLKLTREASFWGKAPLPRTDAEAGERLLSLYSADLIAETRVLLVTAHHTEPAWAKRVADAVADEFVESNQQHRDVSTQQASQQLADELDSLRKALHDSEVALYEFKNKHDMLSVSLEDKANQVARQIDKFNDALTEVHLRKLARQSELEELRKLKELDPLHVPPAHSAEKEESDKNILTDLRKLYVEEERRLAELQAKYQNAHPLVQQQTSKVNLVLRELKREAEVAQTAASIRYDMITREEQKVLQQIESLKQEGLRLTRLEIEYNKLKRDADSLQKQYTMVLNRTKEAGMVGRIKFNNLHVLDYARLPRVPVSPRVRLVLALAALVSLFLGIGLVFAIHALDRSVKSQSDVEEKLLLPFLGMLPRVEAEQGTEGDLYVAERPRSTVAEACRAIRTNVLFAGAERPLKKILVTSSVAREGKTLSCVSLASTLAQGGARVLVVDADLRRPRLHKALGVREQRGLTNVLLGDVEADAVIRKTRVENLWVLPSGPVPPNPAELLDGSRFRKLLAELAERFDRVLIDSPPAVPVTDPMILATAVDGVILVVRHAQTSREAVRRAAKGILDVGGRIIGVMLNDVDTHRQGYRDYGAYYYHSEYHADAEPKTTPREART